jgi:hypothetical protein
LPGWAETVVLVLGMLPMSGNEAPASAAVLAFALLIVLSAAASAML